MMKRNFFVAAFAVCAAMIAGCTKDAAVETVAEQCDLSFRVETDASDSRIAFGDGRYSWQGDERLGVYVASAIPTYNVEGAVEVRDGAGYCTVRVNRFEAGNKMFAYFPYLKDNAGDTSSAVRMAVPAVQTQAKAGELNGANMPMVAVPQVLEGTSGNVAPSVTMRSLGGLLCVKVYAAGKYAGEKVRSVSYADENTAMAGEFTFDITRADDEASLVLPTLDGHKVMTTLDEPYEVGASKADAAAVYMVLAAGAYEGMFTVTTDKAIYTYNYKREIKRNTYYDLFIDLSAATARRAIDGEWGGGDGSVENPYIVASATDLVRLASLCNDTATRTEYADKHYRQIANIDMADETAFVPIGATAETAFAGSYDGGDFAISNLKITTGDTGACGLFGYLNGASVSNIVLKDCEYSSTGQSVGGIAAIAEQSAVSDCSVGGTLTGSSATEFDGYASSIVGGVAGRATDSKIENCKMAGRIIVKTLAGGIVGYANNTAINDCTLASSAAIDAESYFIGGIAGRARYGSTVRRCTVEGKVSTLSGNYVGGVVGHLTSGGAYDCTVTRNASISSRGNHTGGIIGALQANETLASDNGNAVANVERCTVDVMVFGGMNVGGICGYQGATADHKVCVSDCKAAGAITGYSYSVGGIVGCISSKGYCSIEDCVVMGNVFSSSYSVGGIVGSATSDAECVIDGCIAYGDCRGLYSVGGIGGYFKCGAATTVYKVVNCLYAGKHIEATGNNGKNGYTLAAGIVGWLQSASSKIYVVNCASRVAEVATVGKYGTYPSKNNTLAGVFGFLNGATAKSLFYGVYTSIAKEGLSTDGTTYDKTAASNYFGGVYGKVQEASFDNSIFSHCYYNPAVAKAGPSVDKLPGFDASTVTAYADSADLLAKMNAAVEAYDGECGIVLRRWTTDTDGYPVLEGMTTGLPVTRTKRISVIGDSISTFRGFVPAGYSCHYPTADNDVTSVSQTYWYRLAYELMSDAVIDRNIAYSGTAVARTTDTSYSSQSWYGKDFCTRFIAQDGVGNPDIVLIHGGTNDYGHNADELAPGVEMRSTSAPSETVMNGLFATADAATDRAAVEALDDTTFCTAYIKLVCMVRNRYPNAKIVCIIGDYLTTGIEKSTIAIAEHYGCRYVDLLAVNGYNDQTYMPKHDYNPATGRGCHPSAKAMKFIAEKIYTELGDWLEE